MFRKGRRIRKLEIERLMGRQAWSAKELCVRLKVSPLNMRRYLRRYLASGRLIRKKFGVTWYYAPTVLNKPPVHTYPCPRCSARMDVYKRDCGCMFQICGKDESHSVWLYCKIHQASKPRFEKIEVTCTSCGIKEIVTRDNKEASISPPWKYHGEMQLPGMERKQSVWECPKCKKTDEELKKE